ncbi:exo-alpha-sialidase [bacterium]|nr:exo-alpha-sialidase [bacterium]
MRFAIAVLAVWMLFVGYPTALECGDDDDDSTFPPEEQEPLFEKGFILPKDSLECAPYDTGIPQFNCNNHGSTIAELPDGTIAAVWYHGVAEKSRDARIVWSLKEPGAEEWTWPEVIYDDPEHSEGNPALWVDEDGKLTVFFVSIFGDSWNQSVVRMITSADQGDTWSPATTLRDDYCWMTRHRPVRLANGELFLPLYNECLAYPVFMRSGDNFATWTEEENLSLKFYWDHRGQIQPSLVVLDDGTVSALTRDGTLDNHIKRMVSDDSGAAWTASESTALPNSGTSIDQVRLLDGNVVVVYNDAPDARFPLTVALSRDGGATFDAEKNLIDECDAPACAYDYPSITQSTHDGSIWVTYSHNRRTIGWVHFNEAWVLGN